MRFADKQGALVLIFLLNDGFTDSPLLGWDGVIMCRARAPREFRQRITQRTMSAVPTVCASHEKSRPIIDIHWWLL